MFWFKNAMIYRLTKTIDLTNLQDKLAQQKFVPCAPNDKSNFGWIEPLKDSDLLHHSTMGHILIVAQKEEKDLPEAVIKRELDVLIEKHEKAENRKLKKTEKQSLKDDVITTLLPRAFSKYKQTAIWINTNKLLIYVDAATSSRAEDALALLRKSLGSLPVVPLKFAKEPALVMKDWIIQEQTPAWLEVLDESQLRDVATDGELKSKQISLDSEEMLAFAEHCFVTKLALDWEDNLKFVLNEDGSLKRLKFDDCVREKNDDILKEDFVQRFDADFVLMTGVLSQLIENLLSEFGGELERL